jgi:hypothetical protein
MHSVCFDIDGNILIASGVVIHRYAGTGKCSKEIKAHKSDHAEHSVTSNFQKFCNDFAH